MSILAQIIGLACLLFWGFWLCCKLRLPAGFAPLCGLCFCMVVLQLAGSCNQLWLGAQLLLVGAVLTLAQRRRHEILPQLLSPGVLAFCSAAGVLMAVFAIRQPEFQTWDEFSHWGIYFKSVFYQHRFAVWDTTRSLAHQAYPQGLPGLYALFALPAAQYREADVLFVTALPLAGAKASHYAAGHSPPPAHRLYCLRLPGRTGAVLAVCPRYPLYDCLYGRPGGCPVCCGALCYPAALCC